MKKSRGFAFLTAAALLAGAAAFAADSDKNAQKTFTVTLKSGKVLQDAYILDKKPNGITLAYRDGCIFIPFSDMPLEYQQKFGYDPIKSTRYEKKQDEQKRLLEKKEKERADRNRQHAADGGKRSKNRQIEAQRQKVRKLELELNEAKKRLESTESTLGQDRNTLGMSSVESGRASIESPWGYGGRIRNGEHNGAVRNKLLKEVDTLSSKRDNQAQDVMNLQLKLEAAQRTLDELLEKE